MTIPTLSPAPAETPNRYGGDPAAFDAAMQAVITWMAARAAQDPAFLAWIDAKATGVDAGAAAVAAQSPVSNASAAAASAGAALAHLREFKGRFYGPLAADPTLDPLGDACGVGDAYYNTVNGVMMVFNALGRWHNYEATAAGHAVGAANSAAQAQGSQINASAALAFAAASAASAIASAASADVSAQAAAAAASMFASTALGLVATPSGAYFSVPAPVDDLMVGLYRNDSGSATLVVTSYAAAKVDALELSQTINCITAASASVATQAAVVPLIANL